MEPAYNRVEDQCNDQANIFSFNYDVDASMAS